MEGLEIIRAKRGLRSKLAKALSITPGAIYQWKEVPAERLIEVERVTGIPREKLRPDLYREASAA